MNLDVNEKYQVRLKEVFEPIELVSPDGETLFVCMRDGGFEVSTPNETYSIQKGQFINLATQAASLTKQIKGELESSAVNEATEPSN